MFNKLASCVASKWNRGLCTQKAEVLTMEEVAKHNTKAKQTIRWVRWVTWEEWGWAHCSLTDVAAQPWTFGVWYQFHFDVRHHETIVYYSTCSRWTLQLLQPGLKLFAICTSGEESSRGFMTFCRDTSQVSQCQTSWNHCLNFGNPSCQAQRLEWWRKELNICRKSI